jgi:hypothetical protein
MKALKDLSKEELLSFIYNYPPGQIDISTELADCCVCGNKGADYVYICDDCNKRLDDHKDINGFKYYE